jgi:plastocyanin
MRKPGINMTVGVLLLIVSFGIAAPLLYGGTQLVGTEESAEADGGASAGGGGATGGPVAVTLVAKSLKFDTSNITASAGVEVTVTFDNQDAGVPHNVAFYTDRSAATSIAVGNLITGPASEDIVFNAPSTPGSYFFKCDVHPDMTGAFNVQ